MRSWCLSGAVIGLILSARIASGQTPVLVKDISPGMSTVTVTPSRLVSLPPSVLVPTASSGLWRYDDSGLFTCVRDTVRIDGSETFRMADGTLLFAGHDGAPSGSELWRTDGTTAGTRLVRDIAPGSISSAPFGFAALSDGTVLFVAYTVSEGYGIFRTDGSGSGTRAVQTLPSPDPLAPSRLVSAGSRVFFLFGGKLGVTDGTEGGTSVSSVAVEGELATRGGDALFGTRVGGRVELWKSDGTDRGSARVSMLGPATRGPSGFASFGGFTYFFAGNESAEMLWKTDGTSPGTQLVATLTERLEYGSSIVTAGALFFFPAKTPLSLEDRLWRSDGTAAGTFVVAGGALPGPKSISGLAATGDAASPLLFLGDDRFWLTDGSVPGTRRTPLPDSGFVKSFALVGGGVLVASFAPEPLLARYDLSFGKRWPLEPVLYPAGSGNPIGAAGGRVLIPADYDPRTGRTPLYTSDGTPEGTRPLEGTAAAASYTTGSLVRLGDLGFFQASTGDGTRLLRTDGRRADPVLDEVARVQVDAVLTSSGGRVFFRGAAAGTTLRLWATDGTSAGTRELGSVYPLRATADVGGSLLFAGVDPLADLGIWRSDGTPGGTVLVKGGYDRGGQLVDVQSAGVPGAAFFNLPKPFSWELVRSDGTGAGTATLPGGSVPYDLTTSGGRLFFTAASTGRLDGELWTSDGTVSGTQRVKDIMPGVDGSEPTSLVDVNGVLFFTAADGAGFELWRSDGSEAGTTRVLDIAPGESSSYPRDMYAANGLVYFSADDGVHGRELWVSDGTAPGTRMVADIAEGPSSSYPMGLVAEGGYLYFSAFDWSVGRELRKLRLPLGSVVATSPGRPVRRRP